MYWEASDTLMVLGVIAVFMLLLSACFGLAAWAGYLECHNAADILGLDVQWRFFGGCFIEIEEAKWIPLDDYHFVQGVNP